MMAICLTQHENDIRKDVRIAIDSSIPGFDSVPLMFATMTRNSTP
jgi:hypothetical protein